MLKLHGRRDRALIDRLPGRRKSQCIGGLQDIPSASQGTSQGSLADNKVLRTTSQYSNHSGDRGASGAAGEAQPGSRGLSAAFTYTACLGDTRTATVYRASNASGEYAVKVWPLVA